jgi:hypothetical protein
LPRFSSLFPHVTIAKPLHIFADMPNFSTEGENTHPSGADGTVFRATSPKLQTWQMRELAET